MIVTRIAAVAALLALGACGTDPGERALSGGAITGAATTPKEDDRRAERRRQRSEAYRNGYEDGRRDEYNDK